MAMKRTVASAVTSVAGTLSNVTRALLPLAPLAVEFPMLVTHIRLALPWLQATWPIGFVSLVSWEPRYFRAEHDNRHGSWLPVGMPCRVARRHSGRVSPHDVAGFDVLFQRRCRAMDLSLLRLVLGSSIDDERMRSLACSSNVAQSHGTLTRRSVISAAGPWLTRVIAGLGMALVSTKIEPAKAEGVREMGEGEVGVGNEIREKNNNVFGSKAFTRKSYDGFADGYDDLDGGWVASTLGIEVWRQHARFACSGASRVIVINSRL